MPHCTQLPILLREIKYIQNLSLFAEMINHHKINYSAAIGTPFMRNYLIYKIQGYICHRFNNSYSKNNFEQFHIKI